MRLTGKAKEAFEEWYLNLHNSMGTNYGAKDITINRFYSLPLSMQWGILQDWADSVGYSLNAFQDPTATPRWFAFEIFIMTEDAYGVGGYNTRQEARNAAIEKLNYLFNNQN